MDMCVLVIGLLALIFAVMAHEFGHAVAHHHFKGVWLPIRLRWWGLEVGTIKDAGELTIREDAWVRFWGIVAGYLTMWAWVWLPIVEVSKLLPVYLVCCCVDIYAMVQDYRSRKHENAILKNLRTYDISTSKILD